MHTHREEVCKYLSTAGSLQAWLRRELHCSCLGLICQLSVLQLLFWPMFSNLFQFCQFSAPAYHPRYVLVELAEPESCAYELAQPQHVCLHSQFVSVSGVLAPKKPVRTVTCRCCVWTEGQIRLSLISSSNCQSQSPSPTNCFLSQDPLNILSTIHKHHNKHNN